jgi:radical SAM-linked protein
LKVRYVIKFSKESDIKFVSHLDLLRTIQRVVRRTALPVEYSKGFNPHMNTALAQPLSVGMYSKGEYMDVVFTETVEESQIIDAFNKNAPSGIKLLDAVLVNEEEGKKVPQCMAMVDAAKYVIAINYEDTSNLDSEIEELLKTEEWNILKKTKSGEKIVNIKPMIKNFSYSIDKQKLTIEALLSCGSRENLSADLLAQFIKSNTSSVKTDSFVDIMRIDMYVKAEEKFVPICDYVR